MQNKPANWVTGFKRSPRAANVQNRDMGLFLNSSGKFEPIDDAWDNLHSGGLFISDDNKLYFRDETNKDIYINSPAAETLGLSAGNATTAGFVTINEEGFDTDFRVEASGVANALFVQGSDGAVGIGTGSPSGTLDVQKDVASGTGTGAVLIAGETTAADNLPVLYSYKTGSSSGANATLGLNAYINTSGNAGQYNTARSGYYMSIDNRNSIVNAPLNFRGFEDDGTSHDNLLVLDAATGNVGTGTLAPGTLFEMTGTAPYLTIKNSTHEDTEGGRESKIIFEGEQSGGEITTLAQIQASHDGTSDDEKGDLIFSTNDGNDAAAPTERLRIDSAGNVGIGTNDATQKLHVQNGDASAPTDANTHVVIEDDGHCYLGIYGGATSDVGIHFGDTAIDGKVAYSNNARTLGLRAGTGTDDITIAAAGDVTVNTGNLVIGTAGKGIDFSAQTATSASGATTTSELLDHYEEGTFTLTYVPVTTNFDAITYDGTYAGGNYTRIGNRVFCTGYLRTDAVTVGSAAGDIKLSGFPFACAAGGTSGGTSAIYSTSWVTDKNPSLISIVGGESYAWMYRKDEIEGNVVDYVEPAHFATGSDSNYIRFNIQYPITVS